MKVGDAKTWEHTFTEEDVLLFGQLSGDRGLQNSIPDERGRLMVHGLLTATLPTKIGGDMNYLAREMAFQFVRPVFVDDTIRCEVKITQLEETEERIAMSATFVCRNQTGKEVLAGHTSGIIRTPNYGLVGRN